MQEQELETTVVELERIENLLAIASTNLFDDGEVLSPYLCQFEAVIDAAICKVIEQRRIIENVIGV